jgi:hypothetical protein
MHLSSQAIGEAEIGRIPVLGQPKQKSFQDLFSWNGEGSWAWFYSPVIPTAVEIKKIVG